MKTRLPALLTAALLVLGHVSRAATNDPAAMLQRGLFEEEANHNFDAALQAYQSVISQYDRDRKLAATAIFRLGEMYRKQDKTNEAAAQYERVLREFSDQAELARLSSAFVGAKGQTIPSGGQNAAPTTFEAQEIKRIQAMIKNSPDLINARDNSGEGWTPLQSAAKLGQLTVAEFLLQSGADLEVKDRTGQTALYLAAEAGHKAMVELLLRKGADVQASDFTSKTALHAAVEKGFKTVVEVLLSHGAAVNARTKTGATPLHSAVASGSKPIAELLIAQGADVNASASEIHARNIQYSGTPLHIAASRGEQAIAELLLEHKANTDSRDLAALTPLHLAASQGHAGLVSLLLSQGAEVDARISHGVLKDRTPLSLAIQTNPEGADSERNKVISLLLQNKADPNARFDVNGSPGGKGCTPLLLATYQAQPEIVELLLSAKADPNLASEDGTTPLINAVPRDDRIASERCKQTISLLLKSGADVNARIYGLTALIIASMHEDKGLVKLLVDNKADINARDKLRKTALHVLAQAAVSQLMTMDAIRQRNRIEIAEMLLAAGADVNLLDHHGKTPLDIAGNPPPDEDGPAAKEFANLLRQHGALSDLPRLDVIQLRRPGWNNSASLFQRGTNEWNQFTLFELLGVKIGLLAGSPAGETRERERFDLLLLNGEFGPGRSMQNPDFAHVRIRRAGADGKTWKEMIVDVSAALKAGDCGRDLALEWGDVVEVPAEDRPKHDEWRGFSGAESKTLLKCLERQVEIVIQGKSTKITLGFDADNSFVSQAAPYLVTKAPVWIKPAVRSSKLMRPSSDLSRLKVTRIDPATEKKQEWLLDCSDSKPAPDFWLRNGDVIEVPDKT